MIKNEIIYISSMSIISLQETSHNSWKALYQGNYGRYTIKIKTDEGKTIDFSCSCPSDYYPCKHIPMIEKAIRQRIAKNVKNDKAQEITVEQLLKDLPKEELCDFIITHAKYNPQLKNAILLNFALKAKENARISANSNQYTQLLRSALDSFNYEEEYDEYSDYNNIEIEVLSQWLDKAQEYVNENNSNEAILICKACIEEYALWHEEQDIEIENFDISYLEIPFDILNQTLSMPQTNLKELFSYCKSEMLKPKYKKIGMDSYFNELFMELSVTVSSDDFIALQDKLFQDINDKNSHEARTILLRKINFYRNSKQPDMAWDVIRENLQVESFRKELAEKLIAENKLQEAKKLINDFISEKENITENVFAVHSWYELKLQAARKENDISEVQRVSFRFIKSGFSDKYYKIYKSTFAKEEWHEKAENLIQHYGKHYDNNWFNPSVADVLQAEEQRERLLKYVEKYLSIDYLAKYYAEFSSHFPERTLALFLQAIDGYAKNNTGREHYERIANLFRRMAKIEGGKKLAEEMIAQYRILYKKRKAMVDVLDGIRL